VSLVFKWRDFRGCLLLWRAIEPACAPFPPAVNKSIRQSTQSTYLSRHLALSLGSSLRRSVVIVAVLVEKMTSVMTAESNSFRSSQTL